MTGTTCFLTHEDFKIEEAGRSLITLSLISQNPTWQSTIQIKYKEFRYFLTINRFSIDFKVFRH
jgi:hypothetical protein